MNHCIGDGTAYWNFFNTFSEIFQNDDRVSSPISHQPINTKWFPEASTETKVGELLENDLGWVAWKIHIAITNHDDKVVRNWVEEWLHSPFVYKSDLFFDPYTVMMGSSPRFNMYGNEFGMGKALGVRSGYANKFDGKITSYPGQEGGGSIDLEGQLDKGGVCNFAIIAIRVYVEVCG
ncbi:hypothetical protein TSUD_305240 [Trifolium subterraneum]|uniref:Uncharacterized protein n=1 Tax=Trifolium subterraneum TaxID=3900 RepID=A0A2Z6PC77_TRISU|nr:hypothetical protein TSUD_305240 [Trifolium subterraneum]